VLIFVRAASAMLPVGVTELTHVDEQTGAQKMKPIATFCLLALVVALGFLVCSRPAESQDATQAATDVKINKLLVERRDTLRKLLGAVTVQHRAGQTTINKVIQAQNGLLDAELQLADTKEERIRIHEKRLENSRNLENLVEHQHAAAAVAIDQVLVAKAARLQAEIDLLRAQAARD
jgi:outer membrane protein TolC